MSDLVIVGTVVFAWLAVMALILDVLHTYGHHDYDE